jgi:succinate-semialdehyde dehydrogenase/glutarate-semialdehyde dehydrogenase
MKETSLNASAPGTAGRVTDALLERLASRIAPAGGSREAIEVEVPFTGETLGRVPRGTAAGVEEAGRRARAAQREWARRPFRERAEVFLRFHDLVLERQEEALDLVQLEGGKARGHAFEEVLDVATVARYYANTAERHLRSRRRRGALPLLTSVREHYRPRGVIGFIVPWNYPLTLGVTDQIPALMAGNGVLVKPDEKTPFSALWAVDLLYEAGLPPDLAQVITGEGPELGGPLVESVDFVMFTGSTRVGRAVARRAAERLIGCSMELGGKNALILLGDADLEKAVRGAMRAAFSNAGQLCISAERIYAQSSIYDEFRERFVRSARSMKLGARLGYGAEMGSLISGRQLDSVARQVEDAVEKGARVLAGGRPRPDIGPYFYEPTVLEGVTEEMELCAEETFGPVVTLYSFDTPEEAVERANESRYGLSFSVWTRDARKGRELARRLEAGTVNVNEAYAAAWGSVDAPMGGMKDSGLGRRHGAEGIRKYTESQTVAAQRVLPIAAPPGVSEERYARLTTVALKLLRRMPGIR